MSGVSRFTPEEKAEFVLLALRTSYGIGQSDTGGGTFWNSATNVICGQDE